MTTRREALKHMAAAGATAGAIWVAPEILTAKVSGAATLSAPPMGVPLGVPVEQTPAAVVKPPAHTTSANGTLPFTGAPIEQETFVGLAALAGGWALHHWSSRSEMSRNHNQRKA